MKTNWVWEIKDKQKYLKGEVICGYFYFNYAFTYMFNTAWDCFKARADWLAWLFPNTSVHNCFGYFSCTPKSRQHFSIEKKNYSRETEPNRTEQNTALIVFSAGREAVWDGQTDTKSFRTWLTTKVKRGQSVWIRFEHIDRWLNGWQTCEPTIEAAQQKTKHRKLCQLSSVCVCMCGVCVICIRHSCACVCVWLCVCIIYWAAAMIKFQ